MFEVDEKLQGFSSTLYTHTSEYRAEERRGGLCGAGLPCARLALLRQETYGTECLMPTHPRVGCATATVRPAGMVARSWKGFRLCVP